MTGRPATGGCRAAAESDSMNWNFLKGRVASLAALTTAAFELPSTVIEVQPDFVVAARLDVAHRQVRRMEMAELAPGDLNPHPGRANVANEPALRRALSNVTRAIGDGSGRSGLLVSDGTIRAAVLSFDTVPDDASEFASLVRWRMKEHLPFAPEDARLSYQVSRPAGSSCEVLAIAAANSVLGEYEAAHKGVTGGLILPSTAALLPLLPNESTGQLLVNVCCGWVTTVVVEQSRVCSWRTREIIETAPKALADAVATEVARAAASARDHLKVDVRQVWLCGRPTVGLELAAEVGRAMGGAPRLLKPAGELASTLPAAERAAFERFGAPLAGLLANVD